MKKIRFILSLLATVLILSAVFLRINFFEVRELFSQSNKFFLFGSFFILFFTHLLLVKRWQIGLKVLGADYKWRELFGFYLANLPLAKIFPSYSGDFFRPLYLKDKVPYSRGAGLILMEAVFDLSSLAFLALLGGLMARNYLAALTGFLIFAFTGLFIFLAGSGKIKIFKKWQNKLENFLEIFRLFKTNRRQLLQMVVLTLLMTFVLLIYIKVSFAILSAKVPFLFVMALFPLVNFLSLLPISVWGVGVRESAMLYFFSAYAAPANILAVGLTYSFLGAVVWPLLGLPFFLSKFKGINFNFIKLRQNGESK